jgi:hypothetical protein
MLNVTALPFMTKVIAILSILLILSFGLNTWQLYHAGKVSGRAENQKEIDVLEAKNLGLEKTAAVNIAIANTAIQDNSLLLENLQKIANNANANKRTYREATSKAPLAPNCAPTPLRVEKVNEALGAVK